MPRSSAARPRCCDARHLEEVGGIAGTSITEDAETALELHARGYSSVYVNRPMVAGLAPETFASFIGQRTRWAQGMMQILLLKNPLFKRGLTPAAAALLPQQQHVLAVPFQPARSFLVTPLFYLLFGLKMFEATVEEFFAFALVPCRLRADARRTTCSAVIAGRSSRISTS